MSRRPDEILAAIDRSPRLGARSPLTAWLRENHAAFAARLAARRPDWTVLAELFNEGGLTNRYGKPLNAGTARKAWQTVRKELSARARQPTRQGASTSPTSTPSGPAAAAQSRPEAAMDKISRVLAEMDAKAPKLTEPLKR
jgi:hypothetical protein